MKFSSVALVGLYAITVAAAPVAAPVAVPAANPAPNPIVSETHPEESKVKVPQPAVHAEKKPAQVLAVRAVTDKDPLPPTPTDDKPLPKKNKPVQALALDVTDKVPGPTPIAHRPNKVRAVQFAKRTDETGPTPGPINPGVPTPSDVNNNGAIQNINAAAIGDVKAEALALDVTDKVPGPTPTVPQFAKRTDESGPIIPAPQHSNPSAPTPSDVNNNGAIQNINAAAIGDVNAEALSIADLGSIFGAFTSITALFGKLTSALTNSGLPGDILKTIVGVVIAFVDGIISALNSSSDANIITQTIQAVLDKALDGLDSVLADKLEDAVEKIATVLIPIIKEILKAIVTIIIPLITQLITSNYLGAAITIFKAVLPVLQKILGSLV